MANLLTNKWSISFGLEHAFVVYVSPIHTMLIHLIIFHLFSNVTQLLYFYQFHQVAFSSLISHRFNNNSILSIHINLIVSLMLVNSH